MLKYKVINEGATQVWEAKELVLRNRDITLEESEIYLNPTDSIVEDDSMLYQNMDKAVKMFDKHISNKSKIGLLIDCDCDGYLSSSMMYDYIVNELNYKGEVVYFIHEGKIHGLSDDEVFSDILKANLDLLIIPDASSDEGLYHTRLNNDNVDIIVLDHHEAKLNNQANTDKTVIVNNQLSILVNKNLSGTGVTYKFIKAHNELTTNKNTHYKYLDLVATSLISDVMDISGLDENRLLLHLGTSKENIQNKLIIKYFEKQTKDYLNFIDIAFDIASNINAIIRVGTYEDKEILFKALCNSDEEVPYKSRKGMVNQTIQEATMRIGTNKKATQKRKQDKAVENIEARIKDKNLLDNKVLIVNVSDVEMNGLGGMIASKLASQYKRPIILVSQLTDGSFGGSCRGYEACGIENFKDKIDDTKLANWTAGHQSAFGISINGNNLIELNNRFNELFKDIKNETLYEVDKVYNNNLINTDIKAVAGLDRIWNGYIKEPLFAIEDVRISTKDIQKIGNATYKFKYNGVSYVKNFGSKVWFEDFCCKSDNSFGYNNIKITVVGKFREDKYGPYVDIEDTYSELDEILF